MHENLVKLLTEWEEYKNQEGRMPSEILNKEKISIARAIDLTMTNMKGSEEEVLVTTEEMAIVREAFAFLSCTPYD